VPIETVVVLQIDHRPHIPAMLKLKAKNILSYLLPEAKEEEQEHV
jgi:hypothetical protein